MRRFRRVVAATLCAALILTAPGLECWAQVGRASSAAKTAGIPSLLRVETLSSLQPLPSTTLPAQALPVASIATMPAPPPSAEVPAAPLANQETAPLPEQGAEASSEERSASSIRFFDGSAKSNVSFDLNLPDVEPVPGQSLGSYTKKSLLGQLTKPNHRPLAKENLKALQNYIASVSAKNRSAWIDLFSRLTDPDKNVRLNALLSLASSPQPDNDLAGLLHGLALSETTTENAITAIKALGKSGAPKSAAVLKDLAAKIPHLDVFIQRAVTQAEGFVHPEDKALPEILNIAKAPNLQDATQAILHRADTLLAELKAGEPSLIDKIRIKAVEDQKAQVETALKGRDRNELAIAGQHLEKLITAQGRPSSGLNALPILRPLKGPTLYTLLTALALAAHVAGLFLLPPLAASLLAAALSVAWMAVSWTFRNGNRTAWPLVLFMIGFTFFTSATSMTVNGAARAVFPSTAAAFAFAGASVFLKLAHHRWKPLSLHTTWKMFAARRGLASLSKHPVYKHLVYLNKKLSGREPSRLGALESIGADTVFQAQEDAAVDPILAMIALLAREDSSPDVRLKAIQTLSMFSTRPKTKTLLAEILQEKSLDPQVRWPAMLALQTITQKEEEELRAQTRQIDALAKAKAQVLTEYELLLAQADAAAARIDPSPLLDKIRRGALEKAAEALRNALKAQDKDASAVAAQRLKDFLAGRTSPSPTGLNALPQVRSVPGQSLGDWIPKSTATGILLQVAAVALFFGGALLNVKSWNGAFFLGGLVSIWVGMGLDSRAKTQNSRKPLAGENIKALHSRFKELQGRRDPPWTSEFPALTNSDHAARLAALERLQLSMTPDEDLVLLLHDLALSETVPENVIAAASAIGKSGASNAIAKLSDLLSALQNSPHHALIGARVQKAIEEARALEKTTVRTLGETAAAPDLRDKARALVARAETFLAQLRAEPQTLPTSLKIDAFEKRKALLEAAVKDLDAGRVALAERDLEALFEQTKEPPAGLNALPSRANAAQSALFPVPWQARLAGFFAANSLPANALRGFWGLSAIIGILLGLQSLPLLLPIALGWGLLGVLADVSARRQSPGKMGGIPAPLNQAAYAAFQRFTPEQRQDITATLTSVRGIYKPYHPFLILAHPLPNIRETAWTVAWSSLRKTPAETAALLGGIIRAFARTRQETVFPLPWGVDRSEYFWFSELGPTSWNELLSLLREDFGPEHEAYTAEVLELFVRKMPLPLSDLNALKKTLSEAKHLSPRTRAALEKALEDISAPDIPRPVQPDAIASLKDRAQVLLSFLKDAPSLPAQLRRTEVEKTVKKLDMAHSPDEIATAAKRLQDLLEGQVQAPPSGLTALPGLGTLPKTTYLQGLGVYDEKPQAWYTEWPIVLPVAFVFLGIATLFHFPAIAASTVLVGVIARGAQNTIDYIRVRDNENKPMTAANVRLIKARIQTILEAHPAWESFLTHTPLDPDHDGLLDRNHKERRGALKWFENQAPPNAPDLPDLLADIAISETTPDNFSQAVAIIEKIGGGQALQALDKIAKLAPQGLEAVSERVRGRMEQPNEPLLQMAKSSTAEEKTAKANSLILQAETVLRTLDASQTWIDKLKTKTVKDRKEALELAVKTRTDTEILTASQSLETLLESTQAPGQALNALPAPAPKHSAKAVPGQSLGTYGFGANDVYQMQLARLFQREPAIGLLSLAAFAGLTWLMPTLAFVWLIGLGLTWGKIIRKQEQEKPLARGNYTALEEAFEKIPAADFMLMPRAKRPRPVSKEAVHDLFLDLTAKIHVMRETALEDILQFIQLGAGNSEWIPFLEALAISETTPLNFSLALKSIEAVGGVEAIEAFARLAKLEPNTPPDDALLQKLWEDLRTGAISKRVTDRLADPPQPLVQVVTGPEMDARARDLILRADDALRILAQGLTWIDRIKTKALRESKEALQRALQTGRTDDILTASQALETLLKSHRPPGQSLNALPSGAKTLKPFPKPLGAHLYDFFETGIPDMLEGMAFGTTLLSGFAVLAGFGWTITLICLGVTAVLWLLNFSLEETLFKLWGDETAPVELNASAHEFFLSLPEADRKALASQIAEKTKNFYPRRYHPFLYLIGSPNDSRRRTWHDAMPVFKHHPAQSVKLLTTFLRHFEDGHNDAKKDHITLADYALLNEVGPEGRQALAGLIDEDLAPGSGKHLFGSTKRALSSVRWDSAEEASWRQKIEGAGHVTPEDRRELLDSINLGQQLPLPPDFSAFTPEALRKKAAETLAVLGNSLPELLKIREIRRALKELETAQTPEAKELSNQRLKDLLYPPTSGTGKFALNALPSQVKSASHYLLRHPALLAALASMAVNAAIFGGAAALAAVFPMRALGVIVFIGLVVSKVRSRDAKTPAASNRWDMTFFAFFFAAIAWSMMTIAPYAWPIGFAIAGFIGLAFILRNFDVLFGDKTGMLPWLLYERMRHSVAIKNLSPEPSRWLKRLIGPQEDRLEALAEMRRDPKAAKALLPALEQLLLDDTPDSNKAVIDLMESWGDYQSLRDLHMTAGNDKHTGHAPAREALVRIAAAEAAMKEISLLTQTPSTDENASLLNRAEKVLQKIGQPATLSEKLRRDAIGDAVRTLRNKKESVAARRLKDLLDGGAPQGLNALPSGPAAAAPFPEPFGVKLNRWVSEEALTYAVVLALGLAVLAFPVFGWQIGLISLASVLLLSALFITLDIQLFYRLGGYFPKELNAPTHEFFLSLPQAERESLTAQLREKTKTFSPRLYHPFLYLIRGTDEFRRETWHQALPVFKNHPAASAKLLGTFLRHFFDNEYSPPTREDYLILNEIGPEGRRELLQIIEEKISPSGLQTRWISLERALSSVSWNPSEEESLRKKIEDSPLPAEVQSRLAAALALGQTASQPLPASDSTLILETLKSRALQALEGLGNSLPDLLRKREIRNALEELNSVENPGRTSPEAQRLLELILPVERSTGRAPNLLSPNSGLFPEPFVYRLFKFIDARQNWGKVHGALAALSLAGAGLLGLCAGWLAAAPSWTLIAVVSLALSWPILAVVSIMAVALLDLRLENLFKGGGVPLELNRAAYSFFAGLNPSKQAAAVEALGSGNYLSGGKKVQAYHPFLFLVHPDQDIRRLAWQKVSPVLAGEPQSQSLLDAVLEHYHGEELREIAPLKKARDFETASEREILFSRGRDVLADLGTSLPERLRRWTVETAMKDVSAAHDPEEESLAWMRLKGLLESDASGAAPAAAARALPADRFRAPLRLTAAIRGSALASVLALGLAAGATLATLWAIFPPAALALGAAWTGFSAKLARETLQGHKEANQASFIPIGADFEWPGQNVLPELARRMGVPLSRMPTLAIPNWETDGSTFDDYQAWAFLEARKNQPVVVLGKNILEGPVDKLKGVVAHELGHIQNRDTQWLPRLDALRIVAGRSAHAMLWIIPPLVWFAGWSVLWPLAAAEALLVSAVLLQLVWKRAIETRADRFAAWAAGPEGLSSYFKTLRELFPWMSQGSTLQKWQATHPSVEKRIARLERLKKDRPAP